MGTNLDEIVQQQQVKIHDLEKELEKALTEAPTPEAVYSLTAEKPVLNKFGTTWKPTFRSRQGEAFNRYMHRIDSAMAAFFDDKWQPANGSDGQTYTQATTTTTTGQTGGTSGGTNGNGGNVATCVFMEVGESYKGNKPQLVFKTLEVDDLKFTSTDANGLANKLLAVNNPNTGKPFTPAQMVKGARFELKCKIEWKPSEDGKYKNIVAVKPIAA